MPQNRPDWLTSMMTRPDAAKQIAALRADKTRIIQNLNKLIAQCDAALDELWQTERQKAIPSRQDTLAGIMDNYDNHILGGRNENF